MKFNLFIAFLVCFLFAKITFAQENRLQKKADSLLKLNHSYKKEDSLALTRFSDLSQIYFKLRNEQDGLLYADKTIKLAQKLKSVSLEAEAYNSIGRHYHVTNKYLLAEENYKKALEKFAEINNKYRVAGQYQSLSVIYVLIPDYSKSLDANFKALEIFSEIKNAGSMASCYVNISNIYNGLKQYSSAVSYLEKALDYFLNSKGNEYGVSISYLNLADIYVNCEELELKKLKLNEVEKYNKALWCLEQAEKFIPKTDYKDYLLAQVHQVKTTVYKATHEKELAYKSYRKSLEYYSKYKGTPEYGYALVSFASFHIEDNELEKGEALLNEALEIARQNKILGLQRDVYLDLTNVSEKQGQFNDALKNYRQYIKFKELIFDEEKEKEITRKQMQIDFSIRENDYQNKQQLTNLELDKQLLLVKRRQQELLLKQQQLVLSDKEKNIQRLSFLQKQAALENEKLQKEGQLNQQKLLTNLQKEQGDQRLLVQENKAKLNKNVSIFFGVLAVILLGAALFVYQSLRKTAKLNQLVSAQKEELESLGKVKDRIFSVVSHDMRTPVNSLIAFINLLEDGNVSEEKLKKYAANLKNSLGYTSAMMENLLNWAYSQLQGIKPNFENVMVSNVLSEVISAMHLEATQKQIKLLYVEEGIAQANADSNMLALIVRNLLSNAIKFTPNQGEIKIKVHENLQHAIITIEDNGIGMSENQLIAFNNATNQLGETKLGTNQEKGTGLGLTLCKTFAQLMNAKLTASLNSPKGTVFILVLSKTA